MPCYDALMRRSEIIEEYWEEFLKDCHVKLVGHGAENQMERSKAEPTENNFWAWYMSTKMEPDHQGIENLMRSHEHDNREVP